MTDDGTTTGSAVSGRRVPLGHVGTVVDERIGALQARYRQNVSSGVSDLAALRRASTAQPGADPRVWELTLAGLDVPAGASDEPTPQEKAAHAAVTLYAVHQQSKAARMHMAGHGLGRSVRTLAQRPGSETAVRRRFVALGTAATFSELMDHARGLVRQLRSADIPLDYGQLADDLVALQTPSTAARVRLRWGRDYHRARPADPATTPTELSVESEETA